MAQIFYSSQVVHLTVPYSLLAIIIGRPLLYVFYQVELVGLVLIDLGCSFHENSLYFHLVLMDRNSEYSSYPKHVSVYIYLCKDCDFIASIMVDYLFLVDDFDNDYFVIWVLPYL